MKHSLLLLALAGAFSSCSRDNATNDTHAAAQTRTQDSTSAAAQRNVPLTDPNAARTPVAPVLPPPPAPIEPRDIDTRSTDPVGTDAIVVDTSKGQDAGSAGMSDSLTRPGLPPPQSMDGDKLTADKPQTDAFAAKKPEAKDAASKDAATKDKVVLGAMDAEFVSKASLCGLFEVQSSELAMSQATTPFVRDFAQMMVLDHEATNRELAEIARGKGGIAPTELDEEHEARLTTLRNQKGIDFDRQYRDMQVTEHKDLIALFDRAATKCEDAELKAYAAKLLPALREHQKKLSEMPPTAGN